MTRPTRQRPARRRTLAKTEAEQALRKIVRGLRVASRQVEATSSISSAQLFVLQQLAAGPPLSLRELADRTTTDRTSVAHVVERLRSNGYVARARSLSDRRRHEITITPRGRRLLSRAPVSPTSRLLDAMEEFSTAELLSLSRGLSQLANVLGFATGPAPLLFSDTAEGARKPSGAIDAAKRRLGNRPSTRKNALRRAMLHDCSTAAVDHNLAAVRHRVGT